MTERVLVEFTINDGKHDRFVEMLQKLDEQEALPCIGFRVGDVLHREALAKFTGEMEAVLKKHDHKTNWRDRPVEALIGLMLLEIKEFEIALDFFEVKDARKELVDIANFALIVWDRLGMLDQDGHYVRSNNSSRS